MPLQKNDEPIPHHVLQKFLGRGSLGDVWLAKGPGGIHKALKFMRLERSGIKELMAIQRMKSIHHPHLVQITDVWMLDRDGNVIPDADIERLSAELSTHSKERSTTATIAPNLIAPETLAVAMTLADSSLADRLEQCEAEGKEGIPRDELLAYFQEAAKGLDFLNRPHAELGGSAMQHCDVKPQNILLVGGSVQICDFGLARLVGEQKTMNQVEGTLAFIAPEAAKGKQPTPTTDQYSLAVSYFQLLTGKFPFDQDASMYTILAVHTSGSLDFSLATPKEQKVLRKATAVNPEKRYPTTQAFVDALVEANAPERKERKLWPALTAVGVPLALLSCLLLAYALYPRRSPAIDLPEHFAAVVDSGSEEIGGLEYPKQIVRAFGEEDEVAFLLIHEPLEERLFYIMENKVWQSLFQRYVDADPDRFKDAPWAVRGAEGDRLPAFFMTVEQAYGFSQWLVGDKGHLPSIEEWKTAAGFYRPDRTGDGPFLSPFGPEDLGLNRENPLPVGTAPNDVSLFGIRDMAANGFEFTRNIYSELLEVPHGSPDDFTGVVFLGQKQTEAAPIRFADLERHDRMPAVYNSPWPNTGFRVVIQKPGVVFE